MAFADPQSIEYDGDTYTFPRIGSGASSGKFYSPMGTTGADLTLSISHSYGRRTRRVARLDVGLVNPNPFATGVSSRESTSVYMVVDTPAANGLVLPSVALLSVAAFQTWIDNNSSALHLVQGQS
jgi:hypothetical protein